MPLVTDSRCDCANKQGNHEIVCVYWPLSLNGAPRFPPGSTGARMYAIRMPDGRLITDPEWLCPADVMRSSHGHGVTQMPGELVEIED